MKRRHVIFAILLCSLLNICYSCHREAGGSLEQDMYYTNGRDLYVQHCQNCHGEKGEGLADLIPPLTDTTYLKQNRNKLACYIKNGMEGKIVVDGRTFEDKMPAHEEFTDIDLAQLIVFITNAYGNKQGMYSTADAARDLQNCK
jgi:mono/diheme cytochrome c family protein